MTACSISSEVGFITNFRSGRRNSGNLESCTALLTSRSNTGYSLAFRAIKLGWYVGITLVDSRLGKVHGSIEPLQCVIPVPGSAFPCENPCLPVRKYIGQLPQAR